MSRPLIIGTPAGVRRLSAADLPIRIGTGAGADIRVPGPLSGGIMGLISHLDDRPFIQVAGEASVIAVNGQPVQATQWLEDGDVITLNALRIECHFDAAALRLSVAYTDIEYATLPPVEVGARTGGGTIAARRMSALPQPDGATRRLWPWLLYGALGLFAAVMLLLVTARAVRMDVTPTGARISLSGSWLPVKIGGRYLLRPGVYKVHMEAGGYEPQTQDVTVGDAPSQDFRFELKKLPGRLTITAYPAVPFRVAVDGQELRAEAGGEFRIAAGDRAIRVLADRYQPFEKQLTIEGREVRQEFIAELKPNWADVLVNSEPPGATIRVGDDSLGTTPATVPVIAGAAAQLELQKDGYKPWRQTLSVMAGQRLELPLVRLQETDGLLTVVTAPPGAAVTIDGRFRGATPLEMEITPGRSHKVIVAKPGYESLTRTVTIERRGAAALRLDLKQRVGVVRIDSDPADADLIINGERRGSAHQELSLPALPQRIEVRKDGFVPFATEITPKPGLPQLIEVRLLTPQQAVLAATPKTVTTKQGSVLRLIEPGEFDMGAPRREQGRRPNESPHHVRITRRFYIGTREITNREFREFKPNHTSGAERYRELAGGEHPVVMLSWEEAASFCNWLSDRESLAPAYTLKDGSLRLADPPATGYRLPTEAEWEWASRYNGGGGARRYPWGDEMPPPEGAGNFADQSARGMVPNVLSSYDDSYPVTAPVGSFKPSPLGLYDIGGNAAEWMHDLYTVYSDGAAGPATDPVGPVTGQYHVIRGSSWRYASISELRLAYRDFGDQGRLDVGFRIARAAD